MKADVDADENLETSAEQQSHSLYETCAHGGDGEKTGRSMLRTLNPNVCLTRLNIESELMKTSSHVNVARASTESPLRRELLTRRALNTTRHPPGRQDSNAATKSKRNSASKTRANCRCFGRPLVCSVCLTRSWLCQL